MAQFLEWLADACCFGLFLYKWIIIAAVIMTWVSADPHNRIVQWIGRVTPVSYTHLTLPTILRV